MFTSRADFPALPIIDRSPRDAANCDESRRRRREIVRHANFSFLVPDIIIAQVAIRSHWATLCSARVSIKLKSSKNRVKRSLGLTLINFNKRILIDFNEPILIILISNSIVQSLSIVSDEVLSRTCLTSKTFDSISILRNCV